MTRRVEAAWVLAVVYAGVVTAVAGVLLLTGSLLAAVPRLPGGVERRYGGATMRALAVLFWPVDALPPLPDREPTSRNRYPDDGARSG